ncbi:MAG: MXAN_5187 C-terminal domain-containing protein [Myxococcota bacterium]
MRELIVGVFGVVVLIVTFVSFGVMRAVVGETGDPGEATRVARNVAMQLELENLRVERWLVERTQEKKFSEPLEAGEAAARSAAATEASNALEELARKDPAFRSAKIAKIFYIDPNGKVVGRNQSKLGRGEDVGSRHPGMMATLKNGGSGSALWVDPNHQELAFVSYAAVLLEGEVAGGVVVWTNFNDQRITRGAPEGDTVQAYVGLPEGQTLQVQARKTGAPDLAPAVLTEAARALSAEQTISLSGLGDDQLGAAMSIQGLGEGSPAVVVAVVQVATVGGLTSLLGPVLGVLALGLILVAVGAYLIDNYVSEPVGDLEDGLLAIINGETDLRFELDHKVLGGLVFRINSLLNELLGVNEDDTDDEGRPSTAPSSSRFMAALNVDERMVALTLADVEEGHALRDEAAEDYYKRVYDAYRDAKRSLGDPVDHVRFAMFQQRIRGLETEMTHRHGKPFRFRVELNAGEVVLVAVPLA